VYLPELSVTNSEVSTNSYFVAFTQTFSTPQIRECSISKLLFMLLVCQNGSINIALFVCFNLRITPFYLLIYYV
jgi:hypothetical protein